MGILLRILECMLGNSVATKKWCVFFLETNRRHFCPMAGLLWAHSGRVFKRCLALSETNSCQNCRLSAISGPEADRHYFCRLPGHFGYIRFSFLKDLDALAWPGGAPAFPPLPHPVPPKTKPSQHPPLPSGDDISFHICTCLPEHLFASLFGTFLNIRLLLFLERSRMFACFSFRFVPERSFASLFPSFPNVRLPLFSLRSRTFVCISFGFVPERLASFGNVRW